MAQTTILEERHDSFTPETGEITSHSRRTIRKSKIEPTDEFIKVSKYLNLIYAYNQIPLNLVPISLLLAQRMQFKTNIVYLLKDDKEEMSRMLDISLERVNKLIQECKKYDIIRSTSSRGKYEVNSFLFSTGSLVETRNLQAHFNLDTNTFIASADQKHLITGETVRKSVINKDRLLSGQVPGQLQLDLNGDDNE